MREVPGSISDISSFDNFTYHAIINERKDFFDQRLIASVLIETIG